MVRSLTGSLCLTLPKQTAGSYRLQSEDDSLSLSSCKDFQIRKDVSGETAIGRIGKGGPTFDLLSTTGSISLQMR